MCAVQHEPAGMVGGDGRASAPQFSMFIIGELLSAGGLEREACDALWTALLSSARGGHMMDFEECNAAGDTVFLFACANGDVDRMQMLAEAGCNTAAKNNNGSNALMQAVHSGVATAVRTALDAGWCELEAKEENGFAFLVACAKGDVDCMQMLACISSWPACNTREKESLH